MLATLLESGSRANEHHTRWTVASAFAHAALVAAAVGGTMADGISEPTLRRDPETPLYVTPRRVPTDEPEPGVGPSVPAERPTVRVPVLPTFDVTVPIEPQRISATELFDHRTAVASPALGTAGPEGGVYTARLVDRIVVARADNPRPEYPRTLRALAVEGDVLVRFVVDSTGRVEGASVAILEETHHLFGDAVRRWLSRTRYHPAEVAGRAVRQLVEQRVGFALRP